MIFHLFKQLNLIPIAFYVCVKQEKADMNKKIKKVTKDFGKLYQKKKPMK